VPLQAPLLVGRLDFPLGSPPRHSYDPVHVGTSRFADLEFGLFFFTEENMRVVRKLRRKRKKEL
jgi:hypothetical protein